MRDTYSGFWRTLGDDNSKKRCLKEILPSKSFLVRHVIQGYEVGSRQQWNVHAIQDITFEPQLIVGKFPFPLFYRGFGPYLCKQFPLCSAPLVLSCSMTSLQTGRATLLVEPKIGFWDGKRVRREMSPGFDFAEVVSAPRRRTWRRTETSSRWIYPARTGYRRESSFGGCFSLPILQHGPAFNHALAERGSTGGGDRYTFNVISNGPNYNRKQF